MSPVGRARGQSPCFDGLADLNVSVYANSMMPGAVVLREARQSAGLSVRGLAAAAGVAYSTVARIESGRLDPTTGMLSRLLEAAGCQLELAAVRVPVPRLADLVDAWTVDALGQDRPDWTRLRGFLDHLAEHPHHVGVAVAFPPPPSGSGFMDALLAGIAEKLCDDAGLPRPAWVRRVPGLPMPWISPGTPRMQAAARAGTPPQLAARNIFVRADSLWRGAAAVGA